MTTEDAFVAAIVESPDDDNLRLIFADWLEERGDPRGEFIRVQIEMSRHADDSRRDDLGRRETELLEAHVEEWLAPLEGVLPEEFTTPVFVRGLVEDVTFWGGLGARHLIGHADELFRSIPLRQLRLRPLGGEPANHLPWKHKPPPVRDRMNLDDLRDLIGLSELSRLTCLDLSTTEIDETAERALMISNIVGDEGARMIAECVHLSALRMLLLRGCGIGDDGAYALIGSTSLNRLKTLDLSLNSISPVRRLVLRDYPYLDITV